MQVATSTVAMTTHNLLASGTGARTLDELTAGVLQWAGECRLAVPPEQVRVALGELVKRGLVRDLGNRGLFDVTDPKRHPVISRDRSDADQPDPGWRGWKTAIGPACERTEHNHVLDLEVLR